MTRLAGVVCGTKMPKRCPSPDEGTTIYHPCTCATRS
jgi:hypothetical protein